MFRRASVALVSSTGDRSIKVIDYETGTTFYSFADTVANKEGLIALGGLASIDGLGGAGDYVVSSQAKEHALVFHKWGKTQPLYKCKTPDAIGPIASTPDGAYVAGGGASGKMYVWEVASGSLIKSWEGHFKAVTSLVTTQDGALLVSGSDDTLVRVWSFAHALDREAEDMRPLHSWSGHSLPVTGVYRGMGGPNCRVVSVSLDQTAQVYDALTSTSPLHTIRCRQGLTCVAMDGAEKKMALGGVGGSIFVVDMDVVALAKTGARAAAVIVGAGAKSLLVRERRRRGVWGGWQRGHTGEGLHELVGHNKAVTSLSFSWDSRLLISHLRGRHAANVGPGEPPVRASAVHGGVWRRACMCVGASSPSPYHPPSAKAVLMPLQPFKKHRVDAPQTTRPGAGQTQQQAGAGEPAGDVVLVVNGRRRKVAPSLAEILSTSSAESTRKTGAAAGTPANGTPSAPTKAQNTTEEEVEGNKAEENGSTEAAVRSGGKGGGKAEKKRKKNEKGGGAGAKADPTKSWEEARVQLEAEIEKLKGENEQWKELSNDLWKRLGEGAEVEDEEGA